MTDISQLIFKPTEERITLEKKQAVSKLTEEKITLKKTLKTDRREDNSRKKAVFKLTEEKITLEIPFLIRIRDFSRNKTANNTVAHQFFFVSFLFLLECEILLGN